MKNHPAPPDPYDLIAPWYDLEHAEFAEDLELYRGFAEATGGPVLEIGCGSGRLLVPLAAAGYAVTGVDSSTVMLARCQAAVTAAGVGARVTLTPGDMTDLHLLRRDYRLIFVALGTFNHLPTVAARRAALAGMRAQVAAGATLVLDLAQAEPRRLAALAELGQITHIGSWQDAASGQILTHVVAARHGEHPATLALTHWYDVHTQGGPVTRINAETTLATITRPEIEVLLEATGWRVRQVFGDHDLGEWEEAAPRLILVAQAAER